MKDNDEGQARLKRQADRENEYINGVLEKHDAEEHAKKKAKPGVEASSEGGAQEVQQPMDVSQVPDGHSGASSSRERPTTDNHPKRQKIEPKNEDAPMETNMVERLFQDDMKWDLNSAEDMCAKEDPELQRRAADYAYYDENSWEELDPKHLQKGELEEYNRFCKMGVYEHVSREQAEKDNTGKFVKVKWVRVKKGE